MNKWFLEQNRDFAILMAFFIMIFIIGILMNVIVVKNNHGKMPVRYRGYFEKAEHFGYVENTEVELWYLTDIFRLNPINGKIGYVFSIGDYFIVMGGYSIIGIFLCYCLFVLGYFCDKLVDLYLRRKNARM